MDRRLSAFSALAAFAGGVFVGMFLTSHRSRRMGEHIVHSAQEGSEWINERAETARRRILEAGDEAAEKLREGMREVIQNILPDLADDPEAWEDVFVQTAQDLKQMRK
jgi:hypothetical protein